jgi:hypothetical protein
MSLTESHAGNNYIHAIFHRIASFHQIEFFRVCTRITYSKSKRGSKAMDIGKSDWEMLDVWEVVCGIAEMVLIVVEDGL